MATLIIFEVTPEELLTSASKIEDLKVQFLNTYNHIYEAVDELIVKYRGESSNAFNEKIQNYKENFIAAQKALENYIRFLNNYAKKMQNTERERKERAGQLKGRH